MVNKQFVTVITFVVILTLFKLLSFFLLKKYRLSGNNYRTVVVFGEIKSTQNVASLFSNRQDLGYRFSGFFSDTFSKSKKYKGTIKEGLKFALEKNIDEIYCEVGSISQSKIKEVRDFCIKNKIEFRIIPENKAIYSKDFILEYYGTIPILKPKQLPFERIETQLAKRTFDVIFSLFVCAFLLSWLLPVLWVIVKLESKGPLVFKQLREGINGEQFVCYKFRSMEINGLSDKVDATKNDARVTKIGGFLRKTSMDELPQFFNVLLGSMSVIGPRPHMNIQTKKYSIEVENYLIRNSVKPGITGLAQVSGYRGEIQKKSDIDNRVRLDIFYIENWSFFLDIKIIIQTVLNVFKGDEKAY